MTKELTDWFPVTLAIGKAFCNRVKERKIVKQYINLGRHTVVMAPRRYGKTSLINQVLLEMNVPHTIIELTLATTAEDVQRLMIGHISSLLYSILPKAAKAKQNILSLFSWLRPEIVLTVGKQKLIFHPESRGQNAIDTVSKLLKKLNEAAQLVNKRIVIIMDEFQQLSDMEDHCSILPLKTL
jgi:AAA+ ATPase superfamily predicted ATPase